MLIPGTRSGLCVHLPKQFAITIEMSVYVNLQRIRNDLLFGRDADAEIREDRRCVLATSFFYFLRSDFQ